MRNSYKEAFLKAGFKEERIGTNGGIIVLTRPLSSETLATIRMLSTAPSDK